MLPTWIAVGARSRETVRIDVPFDGTNEVEYFVSVVARGVEFSAYFLAESRNDEKSQAEWALRENSKIKAEDGPIRGSWTSRAQGRSSPF